MNEEMDKLVGTGVVIYPPTEQDRIRNELADDSVQSKLVETFKMLFGGRWPSKG